MEGYNENLNLTYLALSLREAFNLFVQCVDRKLLFFVLFDFTGQLVFDIADALSLLRQFLCQLFILLNLLGERNLNASLTLLELFDLSERGS